MGNISPGVGTNPPWVGELDSALSACTYADWADRIQQEYLCLCKNDEERALVDSRWRVRCEELKAVELPEVPEKIDGQQ